MTITTHDQLQEANDEISRLRSKVAVAENRIRLADDMAVKYGAITVHPESETDAFNAWLKYYETIKDDAAPVAESTRAGIPECSAPVEDVIDHRHPDAFRVPATPIPEGTAAPVGDDEAFPPSWVDGVTIHFTEDDEWQVAFMSDADNGGKRADGFGPTRSRAWANAVADVFRVTPPAVADAGEDDEDDVETLESLRQSITDTSDYVDRNLAALRRDVDALNEWAPHLNHRDQWAELTLQQFGKRIVALESRERPEAGR